MTFDPTEYPIALTDPERLTEMGFWHKHIPFAFALTEMVKPRRFVELGTHMGDSYCAFCQAVTSLGLDTKCFAIDSWEGDQHTRHYDSTVLEELRAHHDPRYSSFSTLIQSYFDAALDRFEDNSIDLLHIDGTHTYEDVKRDFESWLPKLTNRGIVIMHDINEFRDNFGVYKVWGELKARYPNFEFLYGHGLGVVAVGEDIPEGIKAFFADKEHAAEIAHYFSILGERVARLGLERTTEGNARDGQEHQKSLPSQAEPTEADALSTPKLIAFYLPQFHPIPENDVWWGKGFTEWTNVVQARPIFPDHYQPHLPADLGFYDLRLAETRHAQAELAREYGIYGFCYYHYWFKGRMLLDHPFNEVLRSGEPDLPFCLCWPNESWTRNWDGGERQALVTQEYDEEDDRAHIRWLIQAFRDERYIKIDGRPLFLIYRVQSLPDPVRTLTMWRQEVRMAGLKEPYFVGCETRGAEAGEAAKCCDAATEFLPHDIGRFVQPIRTKEPWSRANDVYDYTTLVERYLECPPPDYKRFPCVVTSWDNTPRRRAGNAMILNGSTPESYEKWLTGTIEKYRGRPSAENIIFINAWNEWAEGAHLEPDQKFGREYLEATRRALGLREAEFLVRRSTQERSAKLTVPASLTLRDRYDDLLKRYTELQALFTQQRQSAEQAPWVQELESELAEHRRWVQQLDEARLWLDDHLATWQQIAADRLEEADKTRAWATQEIKALQDWAENIQEESDARQAWISEIEKGKQYWENLANARGEFAEQLERKAEQLQEESAHLWAETEQLRAKVAEIEAERDKLQAWADALN